MFAIISQTFALLRRRWLFYALCASVATVIQTAIVFAFHKPAIGETVANTLIVPMMLAIVYAFVDADLRDSDELRDSAWSRVVERVWAVIIIQLVDFFLTGVAIQLAADPKGFGFLYATLLDFALAGLVFADVIAVVGTEGNPIWLIQHSIGRSVWTIVHGRGNLLRAITLVVLGFAVSFAGTGIFDGLNGLKIAHAQFWAATPFITFVSVPLAVLTVVLYRICVTATNEATPKN